ncbi:MAG: hypothetical protein AB7G13_32110 [Lautropia sp.]
MKQPGRASRRCPPRRAFKVVAAIATLLPALAAPVAAQPAGGMPGATASANVAGPVVQPHPSGIFFDWRPLQQQAMRSAAASRPSVDRLQRVDVVDAAGFGRPMTALTLEVPPGWSAQGGVDWDQSVECPWNGPRMRWSAASPDGLFGIAILPELGWQIASRPVDQFDPCPAAPMASPRDYLLFVAQRARPGIVVLGYRDRPELVAAANARQRSQPTGPLGPSQHYAGELLVGYTLQGQPMRESLVVALTHTPLANGAVAVNTQITLGVRAPDGLLDLAFAERIRSSLRYDEVWYGERTRWAMAKWAQARARAAASINAWHQRRMQEITLAGMTARHRIRMDTIAEIGRINQQIVASRSASNDRIHADTLRAIQEVQPWRDPSTGRQVDLSIHYQHAWQLSDGRQFLTNDASFDPNRDLDLAARRLEPVR